MFLTFVILLPQENLSITFHTKHDDQIKCVNTMFQDMFKHHNTKQTFQSVCMWWQLVWIYLKHLVHASTMKNRFSTLNDNTKVVVQLSNYCLCYIFKSPKRKPKTQKYVNSLSHVRRTMFMRYNTKLSWTQIWWNLHPYDNYKS